MAAKKKTTKAKKVKVENSDVSETSEEVKPKTTSSQNIPSTWE